MCKYLNAIITTNEQILSTVFFGVSKDDELDNNDFTYKSKYYEYEKHMTMEFYQKFEININILILCCFL